MESAQLLIDPSTRCIAARYFEEDSKKFVKILDPELMQRLASTGIAVPGGFANGKHYIFPSDNNTLFARAFTEEYFIHGLMQQGYYWVKEKDYSGPEGEVQKAKQSFKHAFQKLGITLAN